MIFEKILALIGGGVVVVSLWGHRDSIRSIVESRYEIAPQAQSASTPSVKSLTKTPSKQIAPAGSEVQSIVEGYFRSLNSKNYGAAYGLLSPQFIQEKRLTLRSYSEWWAPVTKVQAGPITLVSGARDKTYTVHTTLRLSPDRGFLSGKILVRLVPVRKTWKIDKVRPHGRR